MCRPAQYRLIHINIAITDLYVKATFRIGTNPYFIMYWCPLAAEIRQRDQIARAAFLAFGENEVLHRATSRLIMTATVYSTSMLLTTCCNDFYIVKMTT
jgi:hypothetical protein